MEEQRRSEILNCLKEIEGKQEKIYSSKLLRKKYSWFTVRTVNSILLRAGAIKRRSERSYIKVDENKISEIRKNIDLYLNEIFATYCGGKRASINYILEMNPGLEKKVKKNPLFFAKT